jgi:oligoribonuclease NrnB/cAMP/cGMP phosphodiesterase (DHH superfamily)
MPTLPKPDIILTHESDLDGLLAGMLCRQLVRHLYSQETQLQPHHNHTWRQRPMVERAAWVCDLAFEARLDRPNWVVIDHHPCEAKPRNATLIHDLNKSASLLAYELCRQHGLESAALDRLVHLSNVADLFLEDHPDFVLATDYANLVKSYGFRNLESLLGGNPEKLLDHPLLEVMAVKRRVENPIGFNWSRNHVVPVSPTVGLVNTVIGNTNLVIHQLLEQAATPYPVLVTLYRRGNGTFLVSLRSRNGEAVKIAERLQGGGHANAAGAVLPRSVQNFADATEYLRDTLADHPPLDPPLNSLDQVFDSLEPRERP